MTPEIDPPSTSTCRRWRSPCTSTSSLGRSEGAPRRRRGSAPPPRRAQSRVELASAARFSRARGDAVRHVRATVDVDRQQASRIDGFQRFRRMQDAEEATELARRAPRARPSERSASAGSTPGSEPVREERPRKALARSPDEASEPGREREGAERRAAEPRARARRAAPRSRGAGSGRPTLLDDPHRVVPALADADAPSARRARGTARRGAPARAPRRRRRLHPTRASREPTLPTGRAPSAKLRPCTGSSSARASSSSASRRSRAASRGRGSPRRWSSRPRGSSSASRRSASSIPPRPALEVKTLAEATLAVVLFSDASRIDLHGAAKRTLGIPARLLGIGLPLTIVAGLRRRASRSSATSRGRRRSSSRSSSRRPTPRSARRRHVAAPSRASPSEPERRERAQRRDLRAAVPHRARRRAGGGGRDRERRTPSSSCSRRSDTASSAVSSRARLRPPSSSTQAAGASSTTTWLQVVPARRSAARLRAARRRSAAPGSSPRSSAAMVFGGLRRHRGGDVSYLMEQTGAVLAAVTFVVFGAVLLGPALRDLTWQIALYAVLSLTLVRMLPVAIAMLGTGARGADGRLPRLVRAARRGVDRLRAPRLLEERRPPERGADPHDGVRHGRALGARARGDRGAARRRATRTGSTRDRPQERSALESGRRGADVRWRLEHEPETS